MDRFDHLVDCDDNIHTFRRYKDRSVVGEAKSLSRGQWREEPRYPFKFPAHYGQQSVDNRIGKLAGPKHMCHTIEHGIAEFYRIGRQESMGHIKVFINYNT